MNASARDDCVNCGCLERIKHIEKENEVQWEKMNKQDDKLNKFLFRINATFITLLIFVLGVAANLGYMILKGL
jgi:hypothetical protein